MHIGMARKTLKFRRVGNLRVRRPLIAIILSMQGGAYKLADIRVRMAFKVVVLA